MPTPVRNDVLVGLNNTEGIEQLADENSQAGRCGHEQMNHANIAIVAPRRAHAILDCQGYICGLTC